MWILVWCFKFSFLLKPLPQISHENKHSSVCFFLCDWRCPLVVNFSLHNSQAKGRSPVCILMWIFRCSFFLYSFPQVSQTNKCASLCFLMWNWRYPLEVNFLSQYSQGKGRSPVCSLMWALRRLLSLNSLLQTSHERSLLSEVCCNESISLSILVAKLILQISYEWTEFFIKKEY